MSTPKTNTYGGTRIQHLEPRCHPLPISTCRRVYLQNLINLLHTAIARNDGSRAYRAWSILVRCPELDFITTWKHALPVFHLINKDSASDTPSVGSEARPLDNAVKEQFLRKIMLLSPEYRRLEVFTALIVHLIDIGAYERALEDLELYLPSFPYAMSPILHTYAALITLHLAQPTRFNANPTHTSLKSAMRLQSSSAATFEASAASRPFGEDPDEGDQLLASWDIRLLGKARSYLKQAVQLEEDELKIFGEDSAQQSTKRRKQKGVGRGNWDRSYKTVDGPFPERAQSAARGYLMEVQRISKRIKSKTSSSSTAGSEEDEEASHASSAGEESELFESTRQFEADKAFAGGSQVNPTRTLAGLQIGSGWLSADDATDRASDTSLAPSLSASNVHGLNTRGTSPALSDASTRSRRSTRNPQPDYRMSSHPLDVEIDLGRYRTRSRELESRVSTPGLGGARRGRVLTSGEAEDLPDNRRSKRARNAKVDDGSSERDVDSKDDEKGEEEEYSDMSIG